jgi:transcriptional regulator with XRE-family HTH domain
MEMTTVTTQPKESHATGASIGFAALLRQDREEAGMSLELLAHKMETSPSYLFRLEKGMAANPGRNFTIRLGIMLYRDDIDRLDQLLKQAGHLPLMTSRGRTNAG